MIKQIVIQFVLTLLLVPGFVFFIGAITDLFEGKRTILKYRDGEWIVEREDVS